MPFNSRERRAGSSRVAENYRNGWPEPIGTGGRKLSESPFDAAVAGVVEEVAAADRLLDVAVDRGRQVLQLDRTQLARHKQMIHGRMARTLTESI